MVLERSKRALCCTAEIDTVTSTPGQCQDIATLLIQICMCYFKAVQDTPEAVCRFLRQMRYLTINITVLIPVTVNSIHKFYLQILCWLSFKS